HRPLAGLGTQRPLVGRERATRSALRRELVGHERPAHHVAHRQGHGAGERGILRRMSKENARTIALVGTRGVPAAERAFATAVEEVGRRLADRGHDVIVYTRGSESRAKEYLGMRVVHLPAVPVKQVETLSHTGLSTLHLIFRRRPDAAFVFNAANSPFLPFLRLRRAPVALHMGGLEWRRSTWGPRGQAYPRSAAQFRVRAAGALTAAAPG